MNCYRCGAEITDQKRNTKRYCSEKCRKSSENKRRYLRRKFENHELAQYGVCQKCCKETYVYPYEYRENRFMRVCFDCYSFIMEMKQNENSLRVCE